MAGVDLGQYLVADAGRLQCFEVAELGTRFSAVVGMIVLNSRSHDDAPFVSDRYYTNHLTSSQPFAGLVDLLLITDVDNSERLRSESAFAALSGTLPGSRILWGTADMLHRLALQVKPKKVGVVLWSDASATQAANHFVKDALNKPGIEVQLTPIAESIRTSPRSSTPSATWTCCSP